MTQTMIDAALLYASWGWHVHPLKPGGKTPLVKDWPNRASTDPATIRDWWERWPDANVAVACGPSDLLVVDLDAHGDHDGLASWAGLGIAHDPTPTSNTPSGGRHLVFSANGAGLGNSAGKLGAGIDTRGDGGYIVAPPSALDDGRRWEWDLDAHPSKVKPAPLPEVVKRLLTADQAAPSGRPLSAAPAGGDAYARAALAGELGKLALATKGRRNDALNAAAFSLGQFVGAGLLDRAEVESLLLAQARSIGLGEREALATLKSGLDAGERQPRDIPPPTRPVATYAPAADLGAGKPATAPTSTAPDLDGYNLTDVGNAERFVSQHAGGLRWCDPWSAWLAWDGRRWKLDDDREVGRRAVATIRRIYGNAEAEPNSGRRKALVAWGLKCESAQRQRAMLDLARSLRPMPILPDNLDADPWLLTCNNGTLNLRSGELHPHEPGDLITKLAPVDYDPDATAPTWERFLDDIMAGNQELIGFLRRAVGYSLTGDTREQVLFILYGTGANGKTTLLETLSALLGEYATKTPTETLLLKRGGSGIPADVARLRGARLVTAVEAEEGQRLAESLVKQMTGGDTLTARRLYSDFFEFKPRFKLWLATNHKPQIRGTDLAIWRRIRLVPFTVTIPDEEQDKTMGAKLAAELPGILAWAVRGCLEWQRAGLGVPQEVRQATADYQAEMDTLAGFIEDCCLVKLTAKVTTKALYESYSEWCEANGEKPIAKRNFGLRLTERGFTPGRGTGGTRLWEGIGLLSDPEQLDLIDPAQERETIDL